jgi:type VI secretion system secreted protein Hcp
MSRRICRRLAVASAGVGLALWSVFACADQIFLTVEGQNQGLLKGSVAQKGWEGKIAAVKYGLQAAMPVATVGGASGKRQYSPVKVTKPFDAASPQLLQALTTGELLKRVTIDFIAPVNGQPILARNVVLQGARVVGVEHLTEADAAGVLRVMEEVTFSFTRIEVSDVAGRTAMTDDLLGKP